MSIRNIKLNEIEAKVVEFTPDYIDVKLFIRPNSLMAILDDTVGSMNWMRSFSKDDICTVSIWDREKLQWISRDGYGEDYENSFCNACACFGIGRNIAHLETITCENNLPYATKPILRVAEYEENDGEITKIKIVDINNVVVFEYPECPHISEEEKAFLEHMSKMDADIEKHNQEKQEEKNPKTRINFNGPNGWTVETVEEDEKTEAKTIAEPIKEEIGEDVATVQYATVGTTRNGTQYVSIIFNMEATGEEEEMFQPINNKYGLSVLKNVLIGMQVLSPNEIRNADLSDEDVIYDIVERINESTDKYSVIVTTNAKGYKDFKVKKL